jgi:hypothetical protein
MEFYNGSVLREFKEANALSDDSGLRGLEKDSEDPNYCEGGVCAV